MRRKFGGKAILVVFVISTILFFSGFVFGVYVTDFKLGSLEEMQQDLNLETASLETEFDLLFENPCEVSGFSSLTGKLEDLGSKLIFSDDQEDLKRVSVIKGNYYLLEAKHMMLVNKLNQDCNTDYIPILFFYRTEEPCLNCEVQGNVLDNIKTLYPDEVMIYSFDVDASFSLVETLKQVYKVPEVMNSVVVVNEKVYVGIVDQDELVEILNIKKNPVQNIENEN
jgi:hypothetical protein